MEAPRSNRRVLTPFPQLEFQGDLRPSQRDVVALARTKLASGAERRLQIAAPPGSGKTVLGLYIWAQVVKRPAVVLSPTAAIQGEQGDAGGNCKTPVEWPVLFICHSNPEKPPYACQTATRHL